ncbi:MAG: nitrate/nitrite transporter NrtS [Mariprofundales bacterium]
MKQRLQVAAHPKVVKTALRFAIIVGPVLVLINHGDAILASTMDNIAWIKCAITLLVPYAVSTLSSINAYMDCNDASS